MVASRLSWDNFGPMVATAAWKGGFYAASRQAFIGDGATTNGTMWQSHFSSFTPILDFIHALTYVFASATTGREFTAGWECYVRWITWVWQGQVDGVIRELEERQLVLGEPSVEDSATHPRQVVKRAHDYLQNNQSRMKYAEYRTQGLPINSSDVESTVKPFNDRVKGTEKFWNEQGAEEILQLRADHLSDDEPLAAFWKRRETAETGQNRYSTAA